MGSELLLVVVLFAAVAGAVFSRKMYFKRLIAAPLRFWLLLHIFKFLVVGMAMSLLCDLLDVPVPKAIGVICAFCEWVPFLGVFVALASLVLLLKDAAIGIIIGIISSYLIFKVFLYLFGVYISEHTALRVKSLKLIISMVMLSVWFGPVGLLLAGPICHLSRGIFLNARINENKVETSMKAA
ncbi:MAG: hypothetical protein A3K03_07730 [Bdellovibrionales bacterium RIFOXYD1_FULL_44_7]|nr:MAG: hypothetical protein A3K03_07730 [Bdellovibrionales bacterium RIFOXYD1_FULL_44_7]